MSDLGTRKLIDAYIQQAPPTMFLTGAFKSPAGNFYDSEEVEIDIVRGQEDVSVAIQDVSAGYRMNSEDDFTNKRFKPPVHKEAGPVNTFDLLKRTAGQNPFESNGFQAKAISKIFGIVRKNDAKIRRAIELQASQVLQTGKVSLPDSTGAVVYAIDYKPKATHFPTAGVTWGQAGDDPKGDIVSLADAVRADGLGNPDRLDFGQAAFDAFVANAEIKGLLDTRGFSVGTIAPVRSGEGGTFQGHVWFGSYRFEMWTYSGRFKNIQTGVSTRFIDAGNVIMTTSEARMDLTFGAIPQIVQPDARVLPFLPSRVRNTDGGMDIQMNAWVDATGENLFAGSSSRPLCIPTAIDTFGCLTTGL